MQMVYVDTGDYTFGMIVCEDAALPEVIRKAGLRYLSHEPIILGAEFASSYRNI